MNLRRRIWAAWQVLRGRPFSIAFEWGDTQRGIHPGYPHIVALTAPSTPPDLLLTIGFAEWLWDGQPFPWATIDNMTLTISDEQLTFATVHIPVRMAGHQ